MRCRLLPLLVVVGLCAVLSCDGIHTFRSRSRSRMLSLLSDFHRAALHHQLEHRGMTATPPKTVSGKIITSADDAEVMHKLKIVPTRSLLQMHMESDNHIEAETQVHAHAGPPKVLTKAFSSLAQARKDLRGGADDPPHLNKFTYSTDKTDGLVSQATGFVFRQRRGTLSANAHEICDAMFYHSNGKASRVGKDWHTGHIIAAALGGVDDDPLNFFPQHSYSNSGGGVWWRMEMIAGHTKDILEASAKTAACKMMITPTFSYTPTMWTWMPSHGYYYVEIDKACGDELIKLDAAKIDGKFWGAQIFVINLQKNGLAIKNVFDVANSDGYRLGWIWQNAYDKADPTIDKDLFK